MSDPTGTRRRVVVASPRKPLAELRVVRVVIDEDPEPDASYLDQDDFEDRREEYSRGVFKLIGVRVEAEVEIAETTQTLSSPGLRGIESDTDSDEIDRIADEEWQALRVVLKTIGVPTSELPLEIDPKWIEWRM